MILDLIKAKPFAIILDVEREKAKVLVIWLSPFDRTFFALISLLIPQLSAKLTTSPRLCCYWEEMGKKQATQLTKLYPFDSSIYPLLLCLPLSSLHC